MAWRCSGRSNTDLITKLFESSLIKSPHVRNAMLSVDRAHYVPNVASAYEDSPQSIGFRATISAPHMHASAAESLEAFVRPDVKGEGRTVLDVGCGSGYLCHVFANMVFDADRPAGKVVGIDHIKGLVDMSRANMAKSEGGRRYLDEGKVVFVLGDGRKGCAEHGPYDAIHVGAAAVEVHDELIAQLKSPGRMFIPVEEGEVGVSKNQFIWVVDKDERGVVSRTRQFGVRYVPLTDAPSS